MSQTFVVAQKAQNTPNSISVARLVSAAATVNATNVKATGGRVYKIMGQNAAAAVRYLKLYNKATAPTVGTDTPFMTIPIAASSVFQVSFEGIGLYFDKGIGFGITNLNADADTTAPTAGDILGLTIAYC